MLHHKYTYPTSHRATLMDSYPNFPRYKVLIGALFKSQQQQSEGGMHAAAAATGGQGQ